MIRSPDETIELLKLLGTGVTSLGRLYALQHLSETRLAKKLDCCFNFVQAIETSAQIDDFLLRHFQAGLPAVRWPTDLNPGKSGVLNQRQLDSRKLANEIDKLSIMIGNLVGEIIGGGASSPYIQPTTFLVA
jgi:hypothetical protein